MKTTTEMIAAAQTTLPDWYEVDGVYVDTAEVAGLSTDDLLDRLNALEQAEAALAELETAVLDEMARRWGTERSPCA